MPDVSITDLRVDKKARFNSFHFRAGSFGYEIRDGSHSVWYFSKLEEALKFVKENIE